MRGKGRGLTGLDVIRVLMCGLSTDGFECYNIVGGVINAEDKHREEDERANITVAECSTTRHTFVLAETVEWLSEARHVQSISNFYDFTIEGESRSAFTSDVKRRVITKFHSSTRLFAVGVEGSIVRQHHMCGARVSTAVRVWV